MTTAHCRCCARVLGPIRVGAWCEACAQGVLEDVGRLQNLTPGELVLLSDIFATVAAFYLARAMIHVLPFDMEKDVARWPSR